MRDLEADIERRLDAQEIGKLLTSIDGIGPKPPPSSSPRLEIRPVFEASAPWQVTWASHHASVSQVNDSSHTAVRPHLATRVSGPHCGCRPLQAFAVTPGCAATTGDCDLRASDPKSPCSRPCTNSSPQSTASPSTDSHSFFHSCRLFRLPRLPSPRPDPPRGRGL